MGFSLEQLHNTIDDIFEGKKGSEKAIFYVMPIILFGFLSYKFATPLTEESIKDKKTELSEVRAEIETAKDFLNRKNEIIAQTAQLNELNKLLETKLAAQIEQNRLLADSMQEIDFVNIDEKNTIAFVDELTQSSTKNKVAIETLETSITAKENGVFKKELTIDMNCTGDFKGILGFVNSLESSKMFSRIDNIKITHGDKLGAAIKMSVSGL